ncbi:MAG: hypothetical protein QOH62_2033 [Solirubrobacteraceae bacterium]|jgi:DNA-binding beta-propeller fold protein YncE|nr:hypothetical protein [Solirubrobacteraceae bacterium]
MPVALAAGFALALATAPVAAASRTVYASEATGHMRVLQVAPGGGIAQFGTPPTTGAAPKAVVLTPNGKRLFVANSGGTTISGYDVDPFSGELSADSPQVISAAGPAALAVTPDGSMLFSANPSGSVSGFTIDQFGHLGSPPLAGATLAGQGPDGVAVSPDGTLLFVAYGTTNKLAVFAIGAGASLSSLPLAVADTGAGPGAMTVAPNGSRVYVANAGDDNVSGFSVAAAGTLAPLTDSPYLADDGAAGIAISPDGGRLLVANPTAGTISRFLVGTDGSLDSPGDTTGLAGASAVAISPDGKSAYVADTAGVSAFAFSTTAALTSRGTDVTTPGQSVGIAVSPNLAPVATFEPVPSPAESDTHFLGTLANDADGSIAKWHWSFGDGATSDEASPAHTYAQPGSYAVTLTVTDAEGCSAQPVFTGQTISCAGSSAASQSHTVQVPPKPDTTPIDPPCIHAGNDGFCGSPDQTAPTVAVLGFTNGSSITTLDAPEDIVGSITPDPSGIKTVRLRFSKAAGTITKTTTKTTYKRVCRKVKGKKKKQCSKKKVVKKTKTKVAACLSISPPKNYLVKYVCSKVPWRTIAGDATFRYSLPVALGTGSYTVDVTATDGAGNTDVLEPGRNQMTFKVVATPSNGDGGSGGTTTTPTTTTPPIDDTGSPFGK